MKTMTRTELLGMAKEIEDRKRIQVIKGVVEGVYQTVLSVASNINQHGTVSRSRLSEFQNRMPNHETFLKHNIEEILEKVRELFPDCDVSVKMLAVDHQHHRGLPTEYKEVSPFSQYPAHSIDSYIVVDWT
jgi:hypothetical protein